MVGRVSTVVVVSLSLWLGAVGTALAQTAQPEEVEPRIVGQRGTTVLGVSGFLDKVSSSEQVFPINFTVQAGGGRFITDRFFAQGGLVGSMTARGEDELEAARGVPALHAYGGLSFYFKPRSMVSPYVGAEYTVQLTRRLARDKGFGVLKGGVEASVSSRASVFVEAGAGIGFSRGDEDELLTRVVGLVGVRLKL